MNKFLRIVCILVLVLFQGCMQRKNEWFLRATYHEACSCNAPCPCPFGLPMTNSFCKLNSLVDIEEGRFRGVDLSGIKVIMSGKVGHWGEYYFPDNITDEQKQY